MPQETPQSSPKRNIYNASKLDFKPPPTPMDLPDLPDPPSSSDEDSDSTPRTPFTINRERFGDAKTPRPPGAWSTPYQTPAPDKAEIVPIDAIDVISPPFEVRNELFTPPASLSRATSLPLRTPAPPGAWMATPAVTDKKKSQRVRFGESSAAGTGEQRDDSDVEVEDVEKPSALQSLDQASSFSQTSNISVPAGASNGSTRSPRRLSSIRVWIFDRILFNKDFLSQIVFNVLTSCIGRNGTIRGTRR